MSIGVTDPYSVFVSDFAKAFGRAVRFARMRKDCEQRDLAEKAGLNRSYLGAVERGVNSPTLDVVARIAKALDMTPSVLVQAAEREMAQADADGSEGAEVNH